MIREAEGPALAILIAVFLRTAACIRSRQAPEIARHEGLDRRDPETEERAQPAPRT